MPLPFYWRYGSIEEVRPFNIHATFARLLKNAQTTVTFPLFYGHSMIPKLARFCDVFCRVLQSGAKCCEMVVVKNNGA